MRVTRFASALSLAVAFAQAEGSRAADATRPPPAVTYSASLTGQHAFTADLEQGGRVSSNRLAVSLSATRRFVPAFSASVSASHEAQEWSFDAPVAFAPAIPWGTTLRSSAGLGLTLALSPRFVVGASPFLEWSYAREAGAGDAMTHGVALSAFGIFSPRFTLGGGAKLQKQFFSTKITPFVIVNWQLSPKLRVANASSAGPLGSGGVELRYAPSEPWELAVGGVYRSARFRLDPRGSGPGDIGEAGGIPLLARASWSFRPGLRADLHAGAHLSGRVERLDPDGNEIMKDDLATGPMMALTVSGRW